MMSCEVIRVENTEEPESKIMCGLYTLRRSNAAMGTWLLCTRLVPLNGLYVGIDSQCQRSIRNYIAYLN